MAPFCLKTSGFPQWISVKSDRLLGRMCQLNHTKCLVTVVATDERQLVVQGIG
ncbi:MAG: hypothetical protein ACI9W6_002001 [Motiliproteus sp.]|jgi:hypothetical protein